MVTTRPSSSPSPKIPAPPWSPTGSVTISPTGRRPELRAAATICASGNRLDLRSDPPLTLRATPEGVFMVGSAAGPVGGDELHLTADVADGASLTVRSVAATMHHPGPAPRPSTMHLDAGVAAHGHLDWQPQPSILIARCDHRIVNRVQLAANATLVWREELVLGRHGEAGGSVQARLTVDRGGRPLLRNQLRLGPKWVSSDGPAGAGGARAVGSLLLVGTPATSAMLHAEAIGRSADVRWAMMPLADDVVLVSAVAPQARLLTLLFDRLVSDRLVSDWLVSDRLVSDQCVVTDDVPRPDRFADPLAATP